MSKGDLRPTLEQWVRCQDGDHDWRSELLGSRPTPMLVCEVCGTLEHPEAPVFTKHDE